LVDFPSFSTTSRKAVKTETIEWNTTPERKEDYEKGFQIVQKHLQLGNSYLVNYTRKTPVETNKSLEDIFYLSKAKYKVYYPEKFVFFSPETFVEIYDGCISTQPMKGTIDASIENAAETLKNDTKEKAEHYTVVDLLRNDLSRVADAVEVTDFQRIDLIQTQQKFQCFSFENQLKRKKELSFGKVHPSF